jgi:hypothetical protein
LATNRSKSVDISVVQDYDADWVRPLLQAVRAIRYGAVEIVIHDGRVVQIERREKVRLSQGTDPAAEHTRQPDNRERNDKTEHRADRTAGSSEATDAKENR